jgi:hypothetical protein
MAQEMLRAVWQTTSTARRDPLRGGASAGMGGWGLEILSGRQATRLGRDLIGGAEEPRTVARRFLSGRVAGRLADWSVGSGERSRR